MTSRKSEAFSDTEHINAKKCFVRLDRNFILRHLGSLKEIATSSKSSENESKIRSRNIAKEDLSKKHKVSKVSEKERKEVTKKNVSMKLKKSLSLKTREISIKESSGNESAENDKNTEQTNVSRRRKVSKRLENDEESMEIGGNASPENVSKQDKRSKSPQKIGDSGKDESDMDQGNESDMDQGNTQEKSQNDSESSGNESKEDDDVHENKLITSARRVKTNARLNKSESSCSEDIENETSKANKEKQLKLNKEEFDESNRKGITCKICNEMLKTYSAFVSHQRLHEKTSVFRCTSCKEKFKHRTSFINHQKREHPERAYFPCEFPGCDDSFRTKSKRKEHEKFHCKYMCRFCKKRYAKKAYMRLHVEEVHPSKI